MQYKEKLIDMIIYWIHCKSICNNDHDNHKSKGVTCIFTSVSGFSFIQHDGVLVVVVVVLCATTLIIKYQLALASVKFSSQVR